MTMHDYDYMCLMQYDVKREIVRCKKCGSYRIREESMPHSTYQKHKVQNVIKGEELLEELRLYKRNSAAPYDDKKALYCNFNGICWYCANENRDNTILNCGHILMQYLSLVSEIKHALKEHLHREFLSKLSPEIFEVINHRAYVEMKHSKHLGIKQLKQKLAEDYVRESRESIIKYIQKVVSKRVISDKMEQLLNLEKKVIRFLKKCDDEISVYEPTEYDRAYYTREQTPYCFGVSDKFYKEIARYKKEDIMKIINDEHKFEVPMFEKEVYDKILERMPVTMSKIDIWD